MPSLTQHSLLGPAPASPPEGFLRVALSCQGSLLPSQVPVEDLHHASEAIMRALILREKYMALSLQAFCKTTARHLATLGGALEMSQLSAESAAWSSLVKHPCHDGELMFSPLKLRYSHRMLQSIGNLSRDGIIGQRRS